MFANSICYIDKVATNIVCEYCRAPIHPTDVRPMAYRLRYHPKCKREVDRQRQRHNGRAADANAFRCAQCGEVFHAKRRDANIARCAAVWQPTAPRKRLRAAL